MRCTAKFIAPVALTLFAVPMVGAAEQAPRPAAVDFFEKKVRPILVGHCNNCHSADTNAKGGLRVDDRNGLIQGGKRGAAVVPGQPEKSLLLEAVGYKG